MDALDDAKKRAYAVILSAGFLHLKWDLACCVGGVSWWKPWKLRHELRKIAIASARAFAFHNLAIAASRDFDSFDEDWFWKGIDSFEAEYPEGVIWGCYRPMFERSLAGEMLYIERPGG